MKDDTIWKPTRERIDRANITRFMRKHGIKTYDELIRRSTADIEWFWDAALKDLDVRWFKPYERVLDMSRGMEWARWFVGGRINIIANCLDRHLLEGRGTRPALTWIGDDGATATWTYDDLHRSASQVAECLKRLGIQKGDTVGIFMPMVPEIVAAFFGCLKIGAVAVPVFSAFGAPALATRLRDAEAKVLFTADGVMRRGKKTPLKPEADAAVAEVPSIRTVVVFNRLGLPDVPWKHGRDLWWDDAVGRQPNYSPTAELEAEDTAMVIYTSGTTGKPKGTVHTHAGCLAQMAKELGYCFDVKRDDVFFWLTDIGWMMGPWEMIGVTFHGAHFLIYEGAPNWPAPDRLWEIVEKHKVTTLGVSPTAIRLLKTVGDEWITKHDLSTLYTLGSTGEPWDPESYLWFFEKVGGRQCPIINISGGTEIVGCLLSPIPITPLKACTLRGPGLGMDVDVFDDTGKPIRGAIGHLVCKKPAPSMTKGFLKDSQRYLETYFSRFPGVWYHGDWAKVDEDGYWFLYGRSDDTIKVAGKRVGPAEVEGALFEHAAVAEAAAIGVPHELKGETVVCFVVLKPGREPSEALREELKEQVVKHLGKTLKPDVLKFVKMLPKTRSAKIVRGAIRRKYLGETPGDLSSVENPDALEEIGRAE
ncbi:MAG: AMP-binding protein [Planctomycetes bacterium]|nr:AMP-binding protein [Planctomycetota bacterium]